MILNPDSHILILGCTGMLGHRLFLYFSGNFPNTFGAARYLNPLQKICDHPNIIRIDSLDDMHYAFGRSRPDIVINAIGHVKQRKEDRLDLIKTNSQFPHILAHMAKRYDSRLVHFSTDCVFSGMVGNYTEEDVPDPIDPYGWSKALGEPVGDHILTLRTSVVGRELTGHYGLLEWFLSHSKDEPVEGWPQAFFSGLTTQEVANTLLSILKKDDWFSGTYHLAGPRISKFCLLNAFQFHFGGPQIKMRSSPFPCIDRSLNDSKLRSILGYETPFWSDMLSQMVRAD